jgi:hypothetical protein
MMIAKVLVQKDGYILVIWISFYLVVWSAGEGICSVCCFWFIFKLNIILGDFGDISRYAWSDFSWFPVVS